MFARNHVIAAVVVLVAGTLSLAGCGGTQVVKRPAEYQIGAQSLAVVPFRDEVRVYGESRDGVDLAMAVTGELRKRAAATNIKPIGDVQALFPGQDLDTVGWAAIGKKLGVDLILTGSIQQFTLRDPGHIMLRRGTCILNFFVFDVKQGTTVYMEQGLSTYIPEFGPPLADSDMSEEELRRRVLATTALNVAKKFYEHEDEVHPVLPRY